MGWWVRKRSTTPGYRQLADRLLVDAARRSIKPGFWVPYVCMTDGCAEEGTEVPVVLDDDRHDRLLPSPPDLICRGCGRAPAKGELHYGMNPVYRAKVVSGG